MALLHGEISVNPRFDFNLIYPQEIETEEYTMATRYYEYSKPGSREKYTEITEAEYLIAKESPDRWFISFGNCVLECEAHQHKKHYNEKNHSDYVNKDENGKKPVTLSFEQYRLETGLDVTEVLEDTTVNVEEECCEKYQYELLYAALAQLDQDELELVNLLYWDVLSQRKVGECNGETQQSVSKKNKEVLDKLTNLMSFKK